MDPITRLDQAFLQFSFAVKLLNYVEQRKLNKDEFDTDTIVLLPEGSIRFRENTFHSYEDLIDAATNNYLITLGASAISMDLSMREAGLTHGRPEFRR